MKALPFSTGFRLIGGLGVILIIFAAAALVSIRYFEIITEGSDELRKAQNGNNSALLMQRYLSQQDYVSAAYILSRDAAHLEVFDAAVENMRLEIEKMAEIVEDDKERDLLKSIEREQGVVVDKFLKEIFPAVSAGELQRAVVARGECGKQLGSLIRRSEQLRRRMDARINQTIDQVLDIRHAAIRNLGMFLVAAVLAAIVVAFTISRSVMKPISRLMDGTRAISHGDLNTRIDMKRGDEFGVLARSFNKMTADLRQHQQKLLQAEKMASLGRLAAGVAHEINNPIGVILGYTSVLMNDPATPPGIREELEAVDQEARQCKRIVEDLLNLSKSPRVEAKPLDICDLVRGEIEIAEPDFTRSGCRIENRLDEKPVPINGDAARLRQVVRNIVRNALDAMPRGGALTISSSLEGRPKAAGRIALKFRDTGRGMSEEDRTKAFDPFFSTKEEGTGLGLSICYSIVKAHRGDIEIESELGQGTLLVVYLPVMEGEVT